MSASTFPLSVRGAAFESEGLIFVGCFTSELRGARGMGIEVFRGRGTGDWKRLDRAAGLPNPSYLLSDRLRRVVYAAHGDGDRASAYAVDIASGQLRPLGEAATGGHNGVALALDGARRFLYVANYASGSIAALPVRADGSLEDVSSSLSLPGEPGPHRVEQTMSHPHDVVFDPSGRFLLVPDKGLDRIFVLVPDPADGALAIVSEVAMRPGAGPRHVAFHPRLPRAFVVNEIDSTVAILRWDGQAGVLTALDVSPALPPSFFGHNTAAEIFVSRSGRHVYVSHRGKDVVAQLAFDEGADRLSPVGWSPTRGGVPRFMTLDPSGDHLLVANEQGDSIAVFEIDAATGSLTLAGTVPTPSPSAIAFL